MKTEAWLDALRSGDYKQVQRKLTDGKGGYCCLGVLCEAKGLPKKVIEGPEGDLASIYYVFDRENNSLSAGIIPHREQSTILEDLDLSKLVHTKEGCDELSSFLITMNDDGKTFDEIADFIEAHQ
jgi:hypothetical protein